MRVCFFLFLVLFNLSAHSEIIDGPANVRSEPGGEVIASLNDGVVITPLDYDEGWYKIEIPVNVKKSDVQTARLKYEEVDLIRAKAPLYDTSGKQTGTVEKFIQSQFSDEIDDKYIGVIVGYTFRGNIKNESRVEFQIEKLLARDSLSFNREWSELFKRQGYDNSMNHGHFKSYIYFDHPGINIHPEPRVIVFFYEDRLFAIYHLNLINYDRFTRQKAVRDSVIDYMPNFSAKIVEEFDNFYPQAISLAN